jgi:hypothetical protein
LKKGKKEMSDDIEESRRRSVQEIVQEDLGKLGCFLLKIYHPGSSSL